ncbi:MAG TPA: alpha/beta fold hydrolase [Baekduia sp.]
MRTVRAEGPVETGRHDGLAWARFEPARAAPELAGAGVVVLHGADSRKENHFDFARACAGGGLAAIAFDARGHGESDGPYDGRALADVATIAGVLRERAGVERVGLRGSSMGGYVALVAARAADAAAVVAICPASAVGLSVGITRARRFAFAVDAESAAAMLRDNDETDAARALDAAGVPLLLMHAEGDDVVPVDLSRALHRAAPGSKLVVLPGGHHRSIQHDAELQGVAVRFLSRAMRSS